MEFLLLRAGFLRRHMREGRNELNLRQHVLSASRPPTKKTQDNVMKSAVFKVALKESWWPVTRDRTKPSMSRDTISSSIEARTVGPAVWALHRVHTQTRKLRTKILEYRFPRVLNPKPSTME